MKHWSFSRSPLGLVKNVRWSLLLLSFASALTVAPKAKAVTCPQNIDLTPPSGSGAVDFGKAVAIYSDSYNDYVVVGAPSSNGNRGIVYYFTKSASATTFGAPILLGTGASAGDLYGAAVAMSDGVIVVGSPGAYPYGGQFPTSGMIDIFEQPRDSLGYPVKGPAPTYAPSSFSSSARFLGSELNMGQSVGYDYRSGIATACQNRFCFQFYKENDVWVSPPVHWNFPGEAAIQESIAPAYGYAVSRDTAGTSLNILESVKASGYYYYSTAATFNRTDSTSQFAGMGTFIDLALVGETWLGTAQGRVHTYTKNLLANPPLTQWTKVADITSTSAYQNFGYAVATSGDFAVVTDKEQFFGTVHRFRRDYKSTQYDVTDDTWSEADSFGTGTPTYGDALGVHGRCTAVGHPATNTVHLFSIDNPMPTNVYQDSGTGITVTVARIGSNGTTTITPDPSCSLFPGVLDKTSAVCAKITSTEDIYGLVTVCFPNSVGGPAQDVYRCSDKIGACPSGSRAYPPPPAVATACCSQLNVTQRTDNFTCAATDRFSQFVRSSTDSFYDTDGDWEPDITDNCPIVSNFWQEDADKDGVGDACDNCPNVPNQDQLDSNHNGIGDACDPASPQPVPIPRGAMPVLGLSLVGLGVLMLQRRKGCVA